MLRNMENLEIPKELKNDILRVQNELKTGIRNHQVLVIKLKEEPESLELQKLLRECQEQIISIGLEQKKLVERLRREFKNYQKSIKKSTIKNGIEERKLTITNALNRARKQNIITRSTSVVSSASEESENVSDLSSPEPNFSPILPHDLTQSQFLSIFRLATHDAYKEMQNRRVERKRRSTTNPLFVYTREWNISNAQKRKRVSPPNTRMATKRRGLSPKGVKSRSTSPVEVKNSFPVMNLPSGLTIERVTSKGDMSKCIECGLPGNMQECEGCKNGFHISCLSQYSLMQQPKFCPRCCLNNEDRLSITTTNSNVSYVSPEFSEKLHEKKLLLEKNKALTAELTQLQDQHSQLTISLRNQKLQKEELLMTQQSTEDKIKQILSFITAMKSPVENEPIEVS